MCTEPHNCTTVSCGEEIQENLENLLAEKEAEMLRLKLEHKRSIGMKESQNRSLQAEVDSLKSQLSDRLRQINIQQEACQLKDNHIKMLKDMVQDLQKRLSTCSNRRRPSYDGSVVVHLKQQLEEKQQLIDELQKQISETSSKVAVECADVSTTTSKNDLRVVEEDSMTGRDLNSPIPVTCSGRHGLVQTQDTSIQTDAQTDELERVRDSVVRFSQQLQATQELLDHKENALEKREWTITELRRQLENQQEMVEQQATNICKLRADIRHKSIELNEVSIQKLQAAISEKDTSMALLELQGSVGMSHSPQVQVLTQERIRLMKELKSKMQEKITLLKNDCEEEEEDEDDANQSILVEKLQHCSPEKVCEAIQSLEQSKARLKGYLDQLLAVVLDSNPNLLEGMPRSQQSARVSPDLHRVASLTELLDELKEEEEDMVSLQNYTSMLLQRVVENSPELLDSIDNHEIK